MEYHAAFGPILLGHWHGPVDRNTIRVKSRHTSFSCTDQLNGKTLTAADEVLREVVGFKVSMAYE